MGTVLVDWVGLIWIGNVPLYAWPADNFAALASQLRKMVEQPNKVNPTQVHNHQPQPPRCVYVKSLEIIWWFICTFLRSTDLTMTVAAFIFVRILYEHVPVVGGMPLPGRTWRFREVSPLNLIKDCLLWWQLPWLACENLFLAQLYFEEEREVHSGQNNSFCIMIDRHLEETAWHKKRATSGRRSIK